MLLRDSLHTFPPSTYPPLGSFSLLPLLGLLLEDPLFLPQHYTPKSLPASSHVDVPAVSTWTVKLDTGQAPDTCQLIKQPEVPAGLQEYASQTLALEFGWYPPDP
jgi:hypothetical protein